MFKIAIAQINPIVGDFEGNAKKHLTFIQKAQKQGTRLVVFSELSFVGYLPRDLLLEPQILQRQNEVFHRFVQEIGDIYVICGIVEKNPTGIEKPLYNSLVCIHKGKVTHSYQKKLLPTYDVFDERRYFEPGTGKSIFEIEGKKMGVTICEDIWQHSHLTKSTCYQTDPIEGFKGEKLDLIVNISGSPFYPHKIHTRMKMVSTIAHDLNCPMVYVNQVGANDGVIFDGYSMAISKTGNIQFAKGFEEDLLIIDPKAITKDSLPDFTQDLEKALVLGIRDYVYKNGFKNVVLGLSGGIDSALVMALSVKAVGKDHVQALYLPSKFSSPLSQKLASKIAHNFDIKLDILPIDTLIESYIALADPLLKLSKGGLAFENLQARIRGNLIMAYANHRQAFMMGCSNKSELAVGYGTIYGDIAGALLPIGDLYKKEVYKLAEQIGGDKFPSEIFTREPSAELSPGQKDTDTLPPYELLDAILQAHIEGGKSKTELYELFPKSEGIIDKVLNLFKKAEFKRYQCPIILKATPRMFGRGWDWPVTRR